MPLVGQSQQMVTQPNCAHRLRQPQSSARAGSNSCGTAQNFDRGSVQCWDVKKSLVDKVQWHSRFRNDRDYFKVAEEKSFAVVQEESKAAELV